MNYHQPIFKKHQKIQVLEIGKLQISTPQGVFIFEPYFFGNEMPAVTVKIRANNLPAKVDYLSFTSYLETMQVELRTTMDARSFSASTLVSIYNLIKKANEMIGENLELLKEINPWNLDLLKGLENPNLDPNLNLEKKEKE